MDENQAKILDLAAEGERLRIRLAGAERKLAAQVEWREAAEERLDAVLRTVGNASVLANLAARNVLHCEAPVNAAHSALKHIQDLLEGVAGNG